MYILLDNLASGLSIERIQESYPSITTEHAVAALRYAAEISRDQVVEICA